MVDNKGPKKKSRYTRIQSDGAILEGHGQVQGDFPTYHPDNNMHTEKLVEHAHNVTLHTGVGLTMDYVRESHWIPRLRRITKRVIKNCFACRQFYTTHFPNPQPGKLPKRSTQVQLGTRNRESKKARLI
jgi:hypothetical protein